MNKHLSADRDTPAWPTRDRCAGTTRALGAAMAAVLLSSLPTQPLVAQPPARFELRQCEALAGTTLPPEAINLPTRGAVVNLAERVAAQPRSVNVNGEIVLPLPAHCRVAGQIDAMDPAALEILFNINLPLVWNGRAIQSGGGGLGGNVNTAPGRKASGYFDPQPLTDEYPLTRGYVTFGSDEGHRSGDVSFIQNDEALRNWAGGALKKTHDVTLALIDEAYGRLPEYLYFSGESAGGKEAAWLAQRYGADYDGIIAVSPVLSWTYIHLADNNIRSRLVDGWLDASAIKLIADATRAACDRNDGLVDGVISRYLDCRMNPWELQCPGGEPAAGCLSTLQIRALNAIREPWVTSVPHAFGVERFPGFGITGDEDGEANQYAFYTVGTQPPTYPLPPGPGFQRGLGGVLNFGTVWVRHVMTRDAAFEPYDFYPPAYAERIQTISALFDATNPDLAPFRRSGGKLIILQHSADNAVSTAMVAEYYRSVVKTMGQEAADEVMRLYVGPGGAHNGTGVAQMDALGLLVNWVEHGVPPPEEIPIFDIDPATHAIRRGMVACVYPKYARYDGRGDRLATESFSCVDRADPLAFHQGAR